MSYEAFATAVKNAGTQEVFARAVGASQQRISYLLTRKKLLPAEFVLKAEANFGVSRHQLRPDIYPHDAAAPSPVHGGVVTSGAPIVLGDRSATLPSVKHHG